MIDKTLRTALRSLVRRYGIRQVDQSLLEIRRATSRGEERYGQSDSVDSDTRTRRSTKTRSALEYVAKMGCGSEMQPAMSELARRFQEKAFLPTFGDIRNFCETYGIEQPASNSRADSIPRVFKFLSTIDRNEIQRIVDHRLFSGPARLGPIADAIRANGRAAAALRDHPDT